MLRTLFAFLLGVFAMIATVTALQMLGHWIWPPPAGFDANDPTPLAGVVEGMPLAAKIWVLVVYATAVELGTIAAVLVQRQRWRGLAMALGLLLPLPVAMTAGWWLRPRSA